MHSDTDNLPIGGSRSPPLDGSDPHPPWPEKLPIPESFLCALTKQLMKNPVIDREGTSYEKEEILTYLRQGKDCSPVTLNPLHESDLVDNKGLRMAIEAALKNATEKEDKHRRKPRRMRLVNPLSASMKKSTELISAMQKVSSFPKTRGSEFNFPEDQVVFSKQGSVHSWSKTAGPSEEANIQSKEKQSNKLRAYSRGTQRPRQMAKSGVYDSINTGDAGLDANTTRQAYKGDRRSSSPEQNKFSSDEDASLESKRLFGRSGHERKEGGLGPIKSSLEVGIVNSQFKEVVASANYVPKSSKRDNDARDQAMYSKYHGLSVMAACSDGLDLSTDDNASAESKKQWSSEGRQDSLERKDPKDSTSTEGRSRRERRPSIDDMAIHEYKKQNLRRSNEGINARKSIDDIEVNNSRRKHRSKKKRESKRIPRAVKGLNNGAEEDVDAVFAERLARKLAEQSTKTGHRRKGKSSSTATAGSTKGKVGKIEMEKKSSRSSHIGSMEISTLTSSASHDDDCTSLEDGDGPNKGIDYAQVQEERRRAKRGRRDMLDKKLIASLTTVKAKEVGSGNGSSANYKTGAAPKDDGDSTTPWIARGRNSRRALLDQKVEQMKASFTASEDSRSNGRRIEQESPNQKPCILTALGLSERRLSHLTIEEENGSKTISSDRGSSLSSGQEISKLRRSSSTGLISETSGRLLHGRLSTTAAQNANHEESLISWGDLDGEIEKAQFLSMKVSNNDALKIQRELEATIQGDLDTYNPRPNMRSYIEGSFGNSNAAANSKDGGGSTRILGERIMRGRTNRRNLLDQKVEQMKAKITSSEDSLSNGGRTVPESVPSALNLSRRRLSDLTIEEEDESNHGMVDSLVETNSKQGESEIFALRRSSSTGLISDTSGRILHGRLSTTAAQTANHEESLISWGDLDGEIEKAQFLSMKVSNNDALKIQRELEACMQSGVDTGDPLLEDERDQGRPAISQRQTRGRRGQSRLGTNEPSSESTSVSDKVDAIMPIIAGSNKTRDDALYALGATDGDTEKAVGILLGFGESFFGGSET